MTVYSKFNVVYRLQKWMDSVPGQTFLNYAYSWGASIVILGTLFKLTHLPGANFFLFLGMGTEVFVFFISAFDRPFDKTTDGMNLDIHPQEDNVDEEGAAVAGQQTIVGGATIIGGGGVVGGGVVGGGVVGGGVVGGGTVAGGTVAGGAVAEGAAVEGGVAGGGGTVIIGGGVGELPQPVAPDMAEATTNYVEELKKLTEVLEKVSEQSQRLTTDSEEMENLNRTLTGICKVYEMQLKSASKQIGTIDEINEQTRKMAEQIDQLNKIYARMIEAMTVNMRAAAPAAPAANDIR